jgi:hypothetical protein
MTTNTGQTVGNNTTSANIQSAGASTQIIHQQQPTQVVIQQQGQTGATQAQIRKVGSSSNLGSLQQKVQVINRPAIQIVQGGQRLATKTAVSSNTAGKPNPTTITTTTTQLQAGNVNQQNPIQFQQVFQQQANVNLQQTQPTSKF